MMSEYNRNSQGAPFSSQGALSLQTRTPLAQEDGRGTEQRGLAAMSFVDKLTEAEKRYEELIHLMAQPELATDPVRLRQYGQESAELEKVVAPFREYKAVGEELRETLSMLEDDLDQEMRELIEAEVQALGSRQSELEERLKRLLLPSDPRDDKNVIMEIRAGTGGEEAALFAADLYRMYSRYSEKQGWKIQILSTNATGIGGFKEIIFLIQGKGAYSRLKYESGAHRVQRVPVTESSGRIHTSAATVAVLPEVKEVEIKIDPRDLRIDVYRATGHGGQSVNTTDSAVRITHVPTGVVAACQDERSQLQNKMRAMSILRARLYAMEQERQTSEIDEARRTQVGTGERSEKIRTYNFPQNRVTDHRIGLTVHRLESVLEGALDEFVEELALADRSKRLQTVDAA